MARYFIAIIFNNSLTIWVLCANRKFLIILNILQAATGRLGVDEFICCWLFVVSCWLAFGG
ncbi:hypothetical protein AM228_19890 [Planktothricoides sp. SR001]|nr:hypothetical protein AM228_19890 [Planktothricoides sp. SR001]